MPEDETCLSKASNESKVKSLGQFLYSFSIGIAPGLIFVLVICLDCSVYSDS